MKSRSAVAPFGLWMLLFTIVPLGIIVYFAGTDAEGAFSFANVLRIFEPNYAESFGYSILVGAVSTVLCLLLAYPIAFSISRCSERMQRTAVMLVMLPMWMNSLLRIIALSSFLGEKGYINQFLGLFGLNMGSLLGTHFAIILGTVYDFLPFMILPLYSVMTKIDKRTIEAAQDLGANGLQVVGRVILPLSVPGIVSGITMVFVPAVSTFIVSDILGGAQIPTMIGKYIEQFFKGTAPDYHVGAAMSLVLMLLMLLCMAVTGLVDKDEDDMGGMMA